MDIRDGLRQSTEVEIPLRVLEEALASSYRFGVAAGLLAGVIMVAVVLAVNVLPAMHLPTLAAVGLGLLDAIAVSASMSYRAFRGTRKPKND